MGEFRELIDDLEHIATARMHADAVPGIQFGLCVENDSATRALGTADSRTQRQTDDDTLFRIASITKVLTAALLAKLQRDGRVDLDAPVQRYVPEFDLADHRAGSTVTTRQLLLHTGGFAVHQELVPTGPDALSVGSRGQVHAQQIAPPGTLFNYNGIGYMVAGRVIEAVTGRTYEDALSDAILSPVGMTRTKFATETDDNVAGDHTVRDGVAAVMALGDYGGRWPLSSGGLLSTARDMLRFARVQFAPNEVFDARTLKLMTAGRVPLPAPSEWKSVAWFARDYGDVRMFLQLGGAPSQQSVLAIVPERSFALVVLTNSAVGNGVHAAITARALELVLGVRQGPEPPTLSLAPDALRAYEGRFDGVESDLIVTTANGGLVLAVENKSVYQGRPTPPPATVRFWTADCAVGVDGWAKGQYGDFLRDSDGVVRYCRFGGRVRRKRG